MVNWFLSHRASGKNTPVHMLLACHSIIHITSVCVNHVTVKKKKKKHHKATCHGHKPLLFILQLRRHLVVRHPLSLLAVVVRHVHPCPCPCALVRPCPYHPWPLPPLLAMTAIAAVNNHHNSAAQSTTTTTRSQRTLFIIDGGNVGHRQLQRQSMAVAVMAYLPPLSTTMICAIGSIPLPPPLTTTIVNKDCQCSRQ